MSANQSFVVYRGPSLIDGAPIVAIAQIGSRNTKTGGMVQTYIIRSDVDPITASRTGQDHAICGACPHRGKPHNGAKGQALDRTCYVTLAHGPLQKWKGLQAGLYADAIGHSAIAAIGAGRMIRLGTYGDPMAVPSYVWDSLVSDAKGWTAYTHQSRAIGDDLEPRPDLYMTSADSLTQAKVAWVSGERTFRVVSAVSDLVKGREVLCPASEEAGKRTTCEHCALCSGNGIKAKSVAIVAHGAAKRRARELVAA